VGDEGHGERSRSERGRQVVGIGLRHGEQLHLTVEGNERGVGRLNEGRFDNDTVQVHGELTVEVLLSYVVPLLGLCRVEMNVDNPSTGARYMSHGGRSHLRRERDERRSDEVALCGTCATVQ
jgi:hypothetical protein